MFGVVCIEYLHLSAQFAPGHCIYIFRNIQGLLFHVQDDELEENVTHGVETESFNPHRTSNVVI